MKTPFPNAFTTHRLGLFPPRPFPFSISAKAGSNGITVLELCPQSVTDIADLVQSHSQQTLLVFDVEHGTMERLEIVARGMNLPHVSYPQNAIAVDRERLTPLLARLGHWEFHLLDHPGPPPAERLERSVLNHHPRRSIDAHAARPDFPSAKVSLHSHDDCHLSIHARDDGFLRSVFLRSLEMYAGTLLGKASQPDVAPVPRGIADRLWALPLTLTFLRENARVDAKEVTLGFSRIEYSFLEKREYPPEGHLTYAPSTGTWSLP